MCIRDSLEGYGLSDDPDDMLAWKFPAVELGPGEYLVVFASGQEMCIRDSAKGSGIKMMVRKNTRVINMRTSVKSTAMSTSSSALPAVFCPVDLSIVRF